jgi:hypothetical protein
VSGSPVVKAQASEAETQPADADLVVGAVLAVVATVVKTHPIVDRPTTMIVAHEAQFLVNAVAAAMAAVGDTALTGVVMMVIRQRSRGSESQAAHAEEKGKQSLFHGVAVVC